MKITPRQKKWLKILAILLLIRFVVGGLLYYVVVYRFKEIVQIAVNSESNGLYSFDAGKVDVSLFKRNVSLQNARLVCNDSSDGKSYYNVAVPGIYLSINSFSDLILHKKFSVDSIGVRAPEITAHIRQRSDTSQITFQVSKIVETVQKTLQHLEIRALNIHDASFNYFNSQFKKPFRGNHIDLTVSNFSKKEKVREYLFSADDVDLLIRNQQWELPDGKHQIAFSRLHFSGKDQRFELDSSKFSSADPAKESSLELVADKIFFNSSHLQDIYQKEELLIDTISFVRPFLSIQSAKPRIKDSSAALNDAMSSLFKKISLKYIDIKDGQFSYGAGTNSQQNYQTERTNLQLFNLSMIPGVKRGLRIDSVNLKLNKIVFITKDSLNQLEIGEFRFNKNHLSLVNANYGPTIKNRNPNALDFSTNLLELEDVSLEELIRKRLVGTVARLHMPVINLKSNNPKKEQVNASRTIRNIFKTLHSLQELIEVDSFRILQGELNYKSRIDELTVDLDGLNSTILINRLLKSDSLVDIKRSLLDFSVDAINVAGPSLDLQVKGYRFNGGFADNLLKSFTLVNIAGTITGQDISYKGFDWDLFANEKTVQMQRLSAASISANLKAAGKGHNNESKPDLPSISIGSVELGELALNYQPAKDKSLYLSGKNILVNGVESSGRNFVWNNFKGDFNSLKYLLPELSLEASNAKLNSATKHELRNLNISKNGAISAFIPLLTFQAAPRSSDLQYITIPSLILDGARVKMQPASKDGPSKPFEIPMNLFITDFQSKNTQIEFTHPENEINAATNINLEAKNLRSFALGDTVLSYGSIDLTLAGTTFTKPFLTAGLPAATIHITPGKLQKSANASLEANLDFTGGSVDFMNLDSSSVNLRELAGSLDNHVFATGIKWQEVVQKFKIKSGNADLKTKSILAAASGMQWDGKMSSLHTDSFLFRPKRTLEETRASAEWQSDYVSATGKSMEITGIQLNDPVSIRAAKMHLDGVDIHTARDKRLPLKTGAVRPMPTQLISNIQFPFSLDTILLTNSKVEVRETSAFTNHEGIIPLDSLQVMITNFSNSANDSLRITASGVALGNRINNLYYAEAYDDSLSSFRLHMHASPMELEKFTKATRPLASIELNAGRADTLYADWVGNKYAAIGKMHFVYKGLSLKILDRKNFAREGPILSVVSFLANSFLRSKNKRQSIVYYERNQEKFVFNYWVKTSFTGLMSSIGIKRNKKMVKQFRKNRKTYHLPNIRNLERKHLLKSL